MNIYTNPDAAGCLLEAEACKLVIKELERAVEKYTRKIDREARARRKEFESIMEYGSEDEIREAYGYEMITEQQLDRYLDVFRQGEAALENHAPTKSERVRQILLRICKDLLSEQREWEFSALPPEKQAQELKRQDAALRKWKDYLKDAKARLHTNGKERSI